MYHGYYRESAKYRTEWIWVASDPDRKNVKKKLDHMIRMDRIIHNHHGSRIKIVKEKES